MPFRFPKRLNPLLHQTRLDISSLTHESPVGVIQAAEMKEIIMIKKIARVLVLSGVVGTAFVAAGCASGSKQPNALTGQEEMQARNQTSEQDQARGTWKADPRTGWLNGKR